MEIAGKVIEIVRNALEDKSKEVTLSSQLLDDLDLDSFCSIMIINDLEDEFNLTVREDLLKETKTVGDIVAQIEKMRA